MQVWAHLMDALSPEQVDWILNNGREERIANGVALVEEDSDLDAVYFLIEGLLQARTRALGSQVLATLGPGEVVGEMSFVDRQRASASVVAAEDSLVLVLDRDTLEKALAADATFAASFYRELAAIACRRLRATASRLGSATGATFGTDEPKQQAIDIAVERLKRTLIEAEQAAGLADEVLPEAVAVKMRAEVAGFATSLNEAIGELLDPPSAMNQQLGRAVQKELLPYIRLSELGERLYSKPRGYGGDYSTLELIYQNQPSGTGVLGPAIDQALLGLPAIQALRNRRQLLAQEIRKTLDSHETGPAARVMSVACGPATEIFDVFAQLDDKSSLESTLIDVDFQALLHISERVHQQGLQGQVQMTVKNLVYLALGRTELETPEQDMVYSLGLIDYFNDSMAVRIIDHIHSTLRLGGRMLLGNFHPANPTKAFLDHILEWNLFHRTGEDMDRLFERSKFGRPATWVAYEDQKIYLLAECVKE